MKNNKTEGVVAIIVAILLLGAAKAITGTVADILTIFGGILFVFGIVRYFKKKS